MLRVTTRLRFIEPQLASRRSAERLFIFQRSAQVARSIVSVRRLALLQALVPGQKLRNAHRKLSSHKRVATS